MEGGDEREQDEGCAAAVPTASVGWMSTRRIPNRISNPLRRGYNAEEKA